MSYSRRPKIRIAYVAATCAMLVGCAAPPNYVYRLNSGADVKDIGAFHTAKTICIGKSEKAALASGPSNRGGDIVDDIKNKQERNNAKDAVVEGCMAEAGYRLTQLPPGMGSR